MYLDTSWIERDVRRWCQAKGREALQSGSAAIDVFRKRASVSAFRVMALCYYLYCLEAGSLNPQLSTLNLLKNYSYDQEFKLMR